MGPPALTAAYSQYHSLSRGAGLLHLLTAMRPYTPYAQCMWNISRHYASHTRLTL